MAILEPVHHDVYPFIDPRKNLKGAMEGKIVLIIGGSTGIGKVCISFPPATSLFSHSAR